MTTVGGRTFYYAVRSDPQESVLAPCTEDDRKKVAEVVPSMSYIDSADQIDSKRGEGPQTREVWWLILIIVLVFLAMEVWYTRSLSHRGQGIG